MFARFLRSESEARGVERIEGRIAAAYLTRAGVRVLDRNWRCREGELDLVLVQSTISQPQFAVGMFASEKLARIDLAFTESVQRQLPAWALAKAAGSPIPVVAIALPAVVTSALGDVAIIASALVPAAVTITLGFCCVGAVWAPTACARNASIARSSARLNDD